MDARSRRQTVHSSIFQGEDDEDDVAFSKWTPGVSWGRTGTGEKWDRDVLEAGGGGENLREGGSKPGGKES